MDWTSRWRKAGLHCAVDVGAGRGAADRCDDLYVEMIGAVRWRAAGLVADAEPGHVDVVIGAELMEAGRAILRGLVIQTNR